MTRFEQFLRERHYLGNISDRSVDWYRLAFKWLNNEAPDDGALKDSVRNESRNTEAPSGTSPGGAIFMLSSNKTLGRGF